MVYQVYLITLIFSVLMLYVLGRLFLSVFPASTKKTLALEHDDLLVLLDRFDYSHDKGVCHGFTLTWAQEAAQGLECHFYNRLNLIKQEKETLLDSLQRISEKIKLSQALSKKEQKLIEVKPFFEAVCLAQSPGDYPELFPISIQHSDIETIYKMIQLNLRARKSDVKSLASLTACAASPDALKEFLNYCNFFLPIASQVAVIFSSEDHTVGFKKHAENTWLFLDINCLYEQSLKYPYQILTSEALCTKLYESLFETNKHLLFHCCFIAATNQKKLNHNLSSLCALYFPTPQNFQLTNCRGFGLLSLAVQSNDIKVVRNILNT